VLILPNTAALDDAQISAIREYVRNGGGLVASVDTSLFNEFGDPRENFALADVLGVDYRGVPSVTPGQQDVDVNFAKGIGPDYWEKRKNVFDFKQDTASILNQGLMKTYVGDEQITFKGPAVRVATNNPAAKLIGTIRPKAVEGPPVDIPAAVTHEFGKGRVVYFPAGFDAAYYLYAYPYQRLVLKHAIQWAAGGPPPVSIVAPMCVQTTCMRQIAAKGDRLVVHLYSDLNTTAFHALPVDDVPLREEVVPIRDIRVTFDKKYPISRVTLQPEGIELKVEQTDAGSTVTVDRLDIHSMVVAQLIP
jgi:hypothetical protein